MDSYRSVTNKEDSKYNGRQGGYPRHVDPLSVSLSDAYMRQQPDHH